MSKYLDALDEIEVGYGRAKDLAFDEQLHEFIKANDEKIGQDDLTGFIESFTFPSILDWCESEYRSLYEENEHEKSIQSSI